LPLAEKCVPASANDTVRMAIVDAAAAAATIFANAPRAFD
jgi:hypothetical protein